jgi:hypothetical protein
MLSSKNEGWLGGVSILPASDQKAADPQLNALLLDLRDHIHECRTGAV